MQKHPCQATALYRANCESDVEELVGVGVESEGHCEPSCDPPEPGSLLASGGHRSPFAVLQKHFEGDVGASKFWTAKIFRS